MTAIRHHAGFALALAFAIAGMPVLLAAEDGPQGRGYAARFEAQGIQEGERFTLAGFDLTTSEGEAVADDLFTTERPKLIVTASLTCPVARGTNAALLDLAERHAGRLDVFYVYTLEAHPAFEPSPYREGEIWLTRENARDGIRKHQPTTLEERCALAREFESALEVAGVHVLVDGMGNEAWAAIAAAPNAALLVDGTDRVILKQGWFKAKAMDEAIKGLLAGG